MAKYYYAVREGKVPGVYEDWDSCKAQVHGHPHASYKKFESREEAVNFVKSTDKVEDNVFETLSEGEMIAYVDGSYDASTHRFSYGVVLFFTDREVEISGALEDPELADMRNVAGEIYGAMEAMDYALSKGMNYLRIYHDYEGIAKWPLRSWKAKKKGTQDYVAFYDKKVSDLNIDFVKVRAHSNDVYNDRADELAKRALGID